MKIAVCDDEPNSREQIKELLLKTDPAGKDEILLYQDGKALLKADVLSFDVIFLDIEMGSYSGLCVARKIRSLQKAAGKDVWGSFPLLIFVTGYQEHMPEAFDVHAFSYVVKPPSQAALQKLYTEVLAEIGKKESGKKELLVKCGERMRRIPTNEILFIESRGRKNVIYTRQEEIAYYGALQSVEAELPGYFYRVHKGYIVNMKMIRQYDRSQVILADGRPVLMSKYRYAGFVSAYMEYLR